MEECIAQEKIHILIEYSQKVSWEKQLRALWSTCFGDPQYYEDFYFDKVYARNVVYAIEDKGMIHLNGYRCKVMGKDMVLPYIVGVATNERYRRQGVMRSLLDKVLSDMHDQRVPFTYLMPAKEAYYQSFEFQSISKRTECEMDCKHRVSSEPIQYLSYGEIQKMSTEFRLQLFRIVNRWLEQQYDVYATHDEAYYDLLYAEKRCQNGDVIFCFDTVPDVNRLCGVFAYAMDADVPYVEQVIAKNAEQLLSAYFMDYSKVKIMVSYPYMIRIVHREAFLELFGEKLSRLCDLSPEELTDAQIIEILFEEKDNIYFAEIV